MEVKNIAGTELLCSEVVLGTDYYGDSIDKKEAFSYMDYFTEKGGNTLDTARLYVSGKSEEIIGEYLKERKIRNDIIISTKCAHPPLYDMSISRLSKEEIEADIDASLKALKTDYIDILWLHRDDVKVSAEEITESLNEMVKKGKIRYFGASNWSAQRIAGANKYASEHNLMGFCASQIQWSCAKCSYNYDETLVIMNDEEYKFYKETKMPVFAFSAQAKGFFEKYDKNALSEKARDRYLCDENIEMYGKIKKISEETGYSISAISLSYLTKNEDFATFPIINGSKLMQIEQSMKVTEILNKLI